MPRRVVVQGAVGLVVSLVFGWLALRGVHLEDVRRALGRARPAWLVPALGALAVAVWLRAERWRSLFSRRERERVTRAVALWTLAIGLLFNAALPARAGELARVVALNRSAGIPRTQGLVAVVVERVFDLAALALLLLAITVVAPHRGLLASAVPVSVAILAAVPALSATLVALRRRPALRRRAAGLVRRLPVVGGAKAEATLASLAGGLRGLVHARRGAAVGAWSVASWLALAVSNWCVLRAFGTAVAWHASVAILVVTNLALVLPATAGGLGVFEAACVATLAAYGISRRTALPVALALHAVNLVPFLPLGAVALGRLGLRAGELRAAASEPTAAPPA